MRGSTRCLSLGAAVLMTLAGCGTRVHESPSALVTDASFGDTGGDPGATTAPGSLPAEQPRPDGAASSGTAGGAPVSIPSGKTNVVAGPSAVRSTSSQPTGSPAPANTGAGPGTPAAKPADPGPGGPNRPVSPAPAVQATPIVIGTIGTFSGPVGEVEKSMADGVAVWVKDVNSRGGVNGHLVRQVLADDGADPARHRSLVRELVERRGVQAFVYKVEAFAGLTGPDPYITEHRIPVVGTFLSYDWDYASPFYFPQASSGAEFNVASYFGPASQLLLPKGLKKLGTFTCVESNVCEQAKDVWAKKAAEFGFELAYQAQVSLGQPDFTAECLAARNAGVQVVFFGFDDKSAGRVANSCARQSFHPAYVHTFQAASPSMLSNPNLDGMLVGTLTFPWPATDSPARRAAHDAFRRFLPNAELLGTHMTGWVAGKLFEEGEKNLPATFTGQDLLNGLWQIRENDLGGLTHPLSFYPDRGAQRRTCWSVVKVDKGAFVVPGSTSLQCR